MSSNLPLIDTFGRVHTDLRISVTDRCNIRCDYCMPEEGVRFRPHSAILSFEEMERFVRVVAPLGIHEVRLTGGEPLVRKGIVDLVRMLAAVPGIDDLAMTTNAIRLVDLAEPLKVAGLDRLNISLDTLDREKFKEITRRDLLAKTLEGIAAAKAAKFKQIKINTVAIRGRTEDDIVPMAMYAREHGFELRFIEFMPLDGDGKWISGQVLSGEEILQRLSEGIGPLEPVDIPGSTAPATRYRFTDSLGGTVGVISSVSEPFCDRCSRLRLTSEGMLRNCLFATKEWDVRPLLREDASDEQIVAMVRESILAKKREHGTDDGKFAKHDRTMHQIGG